MLQKYDIFLFLTLLGLASLTLVSWPNLIHFTRVRAQKKKSVENTQEQQMKINKASTIFLISLAVLEVFSIEFFRTLKFEQGEGTKCMLMNIHCYIDTCP